MAHSNLGPSSDFGFSFIRCVSSKQTAAASKKQLIKPEKRMRHAPPKTELVLIVFCIYVCWFLFCFFFFANNGVGKKLSMALKATLPAARLESTATFQGYRS